MKPTSRTTNESPPPKPPPTSPKANPLSRSVMIPKEAIKKIVVTNPTTNVKTSLKAPNQPKKGRKVKVETTGGRQPMLTREGILSVNVPNCIMHYAEAMIRPFETIAGVCLPAELFPIPSQKIKVFLRGTFKVGVNGIGFIMMKPTGASNADSLHVTSEASVGGATTLFDDYTNLGVGLFDMLPFNILDFTSDNVRCRLVAAGIRIKYIGKLMERNGTVSALEDPDHINFGEYTFNQLDASPYCKVRRVGDDEWDSQVNYSGPVTPSDVEFNSDYYPLNTNSESIMGIAVAGITGDQYQFEVVQHLEYVGTKVTGKTKSHADPTLFSKVQEVAKTLTADRPLEPKEERSFWHSLGEAFESTLPAVISVGKNILKGNIAGAAMSAAQGIFGILDEPKSITTGDSLPGRSGVTARQLLSY